MSNGLRFQLTDVPPALLFVLAGVTLLIAAGTGAKTLKLKKNAVHAQGTVVGHHHSTSTETSRSSTGRKKRRKKDKYQAEVEFQTKAGETVKFRSSVSHSTRKPRQGAKVDVLYNPHHPDGARMNTFFSLWGIPSIAGGLGALFLIAGIVRKRMQA